MMGKKNQYPKSKTRLKINTLPLLAVLAILISAGLLVVSINLPSVAIPASTGLKVSPPPSAHPLPPTLAQWQDQKNSGDYFDQVETTQVGYLVWWQFPVKVYIETPEIKNNTYAHKWFNTVFKTVQEWNAYLPLMVVQQRDIANIVILRKAPPLQFSPGDGFPRARSAQTSYELYTDDNVLCHRFTILLSPSQTGVYLEAAARHELGHALGIWGHSDLPTDALYFSQVSHPPPISPRDVNTLKQVYQQPTYLGWSLVKIEGTGN